MKAGIYTVKHKFSEQNYIVALNGKSPFIRISNVISTKDFANGILKKDEEISKQILEEPENFEFVNLSKEVETKVKAECEVYYTDEDYCTFTSDYYIKEDGNLNEIEVISDIVAKIHISWDDAKILFDKINIRYLNEDKWKKLQQSASISEANCVIQ